jgi:hypothetical protein
MNADTLRFGGKKSKAWIEATTNEERLAIWVTLTQSGKNKLRGKGRDLLNRILEKQRYKCCYCGVHIVNDRDIERRYDSTVRRVYTVEWTNELGHFFEEVTASVDHKIPLSLGGSNQEDNLSAACIKCNHEKGSQTHLPQTTPKIIHPDENYKHGYKRLTRQQRRYKVCLCLYCGQSTFQRPRSGAKACGKCANRRYLDYLYKFFRNDYY